VRAACFGLLLAGLSRFVSLQNHPIKLVIAGIYALWGLRQFQAKAYSQGIGDNADLTIPFMLLPGSLLRYCLLRPMKLAVNGTDVALEIALAPEGPRWCVNLSGGYHHARSEGGGGFCFFNDTALALQKQIKKNPKFNTLIIDLDFHCGDGNADFASKYPDNVTIIDIYGGKDYPFGFSRSVELEKSIKYPNPIVTNNYLWNEKRPNPIIKGVKTSDWYCDLVREKFRKVQGRHFDCIIFNAGTDVYENDELGSFMGLTKDQIIDRDQIVFEFARDNKIPIVQVLSGGYNKERGAEIVFGCLLKSHQIMQPKQIESGSTQTCIQQ
jgi:histone deacetylase 11